MVETLVEKIPKTFRLHLSFKGCFGAVHRFAQCRFYFFGNLPGIQGREHAGTFGSARFGNENVLVVRDNLGQQKVEPAGGFRTTAIDAQKQVGAGSLQFTAMMKIRPRRDVYCIGIPVFRQNPVENAEARGVRSFAPQ